MEYIQIFKEKLYWEKMKKIWMGKFPIIDFFESDDRLIEWAIVFSQMFNFPKMN